MKDLSGFVLKPRIGRKIRYVSIFNVKYSLFLLFKSSLSVIPPIMALLSPSLDTAHACDDPCVIQLIHLSSYAHISLFVKQLTTAFISPLITHNLSNQFSFQDFFHNVMLKIACTMGLSVCSRFHRDLKCTRSQFSLSVFECCLALLILSGKPVHKSSKSSFTLMSQVLDLLKS